MKRFSSEASKSSDWMLDENPQEVLK